MTLQSLKKTPFCAIFSNKMAFFQTLKRRIFSPGGRISNIFTVLRSLWDTPFNEFTIISLPHVYFFGAKVITSFSRKNVAKLKNKKHRIFGNVQFYLVANFYDNPNKCHEVIRTMPLLPPFMPTVFVWMHWKVVCNGSLTACTFQLVCCSALEN